MSAMFEGSFTISQQARLFLYSVLLGVPIGILFDVFRILRAALPHHPLAVFLEDTAFSCAAILILQCYALMCGDGVLRWYFCIGALLGLLLYLCTIGAIIMQMLKKCRNMSRRLKRIFKKFAANRKKHLTNSKKCAMIK